MGHSTRADAVVFGFAFQANAAIVLFLENIKNMKSIKLEGNYEDIEIELDDGKMILAQAKAVEKASTDFAHVRANMKKALKTLSEGDKKVKTKELIMVTNSPNPFNDDDSKSAFYGHAHRKYDSLPDSAKRFVDEWLMEIDEPLDTSKFKIQVIPFETDEEAERYKVILECINNFIGDLDISIPGIGKKLLEVWQCQIFDNGGNMDANIKLGKKDIIWPVLVKVTNTIQCDDDFLEQFDAGLYEETLTKYSDIIEDHCERCEFFIRILSEYNEFKSSERPSKKIYDFIETKWSEFEKEFSSETIEDNVREAITKIVMYQVIKRRIAIDKVKTGTNL